MSFRALDGRTLVAGQIRPEDVAAAAAAGVRLIVNNRSDGAGAALLAGAAAAGFDLSPLRPYLLR